MGIPGFITGPVATAALGPTNTGNALAGNTGATTASQLSTPANTAEDPDPSPESGQTDGGFSANDVPVDPDIGPIIVPIGQNNDTPTEEVPAATTPDPVADAIANAEQVQADFDAEIPADVKAANAAAEGIRARKRKRVNRSATIATGPLGLLAPPQFLSRKRALGA